uniref:Putative tick transposon n=1 Tax=Rhipicephalus microplus TaxID=6941 RepID=A0A6G5A977_RHIMP
MTISSMESAPTGIRCHHRVQVRQKHEDADTLSRAPLQSASTSAEEDSAFVATVVSGPDLMSHQRNDSNLRMIIDHLEGGTAPIPRPMLRTLTSFCLRNGVLYKRNAGAGDRSHLLVVLEALRDDVLLACHDEPTSGHLGYSRTMDRVRQLYYWPKMSACVKRYVKGCRECQRRKTPHLKPAGHLQPIDPPRTPFEQVGMDLLGPFPLSSCGNKWIIVATDYLTRYAETKALPRGTASEVASFLCIKLCYGMAPRHMSSLIEGHHSQRNSWMISSG